MERLVEIEARRWWVLVGVVMTVAQPGFGLLAAVLMVFGAGQGLVMAPLSGVVLARVRPEQAGAGSGVLNTMYQAAGAAGIALVGSAYFMGGLGAALVLLAVAYGATWWCLGAAARPVGRLVPAGGR